ncbi:MAG: adenine deaminase [Candidatus Micrarchaeota archaeon]
MRIKIKNAKIVNSRHEAVREGEILIHNNLITKVARRIADKADKVIDAKGGYVIPGFIDAHVHIESSLLTPTEFSRAVSMHGTTTVIADPHEICNVVGIKGLHLFIRETDKMPVGVFFVVPSCVPASHLGSAGAKVTVRNIKESLRHERVIGLGEVMNFPGVIERHDELVSKIRACKGMIISGHAPSLRGNAMRSYFDAGVMDDHESPAYEEMAEKADYGVVIFLREGSAEKSTDEQYRIIESHPQQVCFCSDDKTVADIQRHGSILYNVNRAISLGYDPLRVIKCASYNAAKHYRIESMVGNVEPKMDADFFISKSLRKIKPEMVFINGQIICSNGKCKSLPRFRYPDYISKTIKHRPIAEKDLVLPKAHRGNVIVAREGELHTGWKKVRQKGDYDLRKDILKIAVIDRYRKNGNISVGQITGFGLRRGAIGTTLAHDCHNIVVLGTSDEAIAKVANYLIKTGGGFVVYTGRKIAALHLPVAGIMSQERFDVVSRKLLKIRQEAAKTGCHLRHPFATLSFMALEVIPELKITDKGLVDVKKFKLIK